MMIETRAFNSIAFTAAERDTDTSGYQGESQNSRMGEIGIFFVSGFFWE